MDLFYPVYYIFGAVLHLFRYIVLRQSINFNMEISTRQTYNLYWFTCLLYVWNGLEILDKQKGALHGVLSEDYYAHIFIFLAPDREREMIMRLYVPSRCLLVVSAICSSFSPSGSNLNLWCRVLTSVFATITFCYRLIIIKLLMRRRTVEFMPLFLCFFMIFTAVYWFHYSILRKDLFTAIPNGFAFFLGVCQLILYERYRLNVQQHDI